MSELSCEIDQAAELEPRMDQGPKPVRGEQKLELLARVLNAQLDEMQADETFKRCYVKLISCNYADLQGKNREKELGKQVEKARSKGLSELPKRWYYCWFANRQAADTPG